MTFFFRHSTILFGARVHPLPKPEPTKRFGFGYSAEPNPQTPGLKWGLNWVRKVWEPDHSQSIVAMVAHVFAHVSCLLKCEKAHGIPVAAGEKVPLHGNLVKKEVVWHDLRGKKCQLMDFR